MKKARIVLDKRPNNNEECPMCIRKRFHHSENTCQVSCFDGRICSNPKECSKIISLAELMCGETADLYLD